MLQQLHPFLVESVCILVCTATVDAQVGRSEVREESTKATPRSHDERPHAVEAIHVGGVAMGTLAPIPHDATIERYVVGTGAVGQIGATNVRATGEACRHDPSSVYCNTLGTSFWRPPGGNPNIWVADDVATAAEAGCELDRYVVMITGNADGEGVGGFGVTAALYPTCPGATGAPPVPGTVCYAEFEDNGTKLLTCPVEPGVALPQNFYLGIRFSRVHCGILAGAPALKGFSADTLDFPGFACTANLGGYLPCCSGGCLPSLPYGKHASFYAEFYVRGECPAAHPAYKGSNHAGQSYTPGGGIRFADDITLAVPNCDMVAIEVATKGRGVTSISLHTTLDDADPVDGGLIPDTRFYVIGDVGTVIGRKEFDPPILLPGPELWVGYITTSAVTGPIITAREPALGENDDRIQVHNGERWESRPLYDGRYATTDVTIHCAGQPPLGACCDMVFTTNHTCAGGPNDGNPCSRFGDCPEGYCIGDSVCREELAEMNCPFTRWLGDGTCEPHSFDPPCGISACCTYANECLDLTAPECFRQPPIDVPVLREFHLGQLCSEAGQACSWVPCAQRSGASCLVQRELPGCGTYQSCCESVCDEDAFCCHVMWDEYCVLRFHELCDFPPLNDGCSGPGLEGATLIEIPSSVLALTGSATYSIADPGVCCHADDPGARAVGTVWYKFVAPPPVEGGEYSSVGLSTCIVQASETQDSVIQVYRPQNPDLGICDDGTMCILSLGICLDGSTCVLDEQAACENLTLIACADDTGCAGTGAPANASLCVQNLVPGETYYVMVGAKDSENRETYRLEVSSPCDAPSLLPNDFCSDADRVSGGALTIPFDLSGGDDYLPATFDCHSPPTVLSNMENDVWYDWVAPCTGLAYIETCDRGLPEAQQPNTTMIVYDGCGCPAEDANMIADSDVCVFGCGLSSCVWINVAEGGCYKIRLGGHVGGTPAGNLKIDVDRDCLGMVRFIDPPSGTVDARRPNPPNSTGTREGIDTLIVGSLLDLTNPQLWSVCEKPTGNPPNTVASVIDNGDGTFTVRFDRPMMPNAATTAAYARGTGARYTGTFVSHPGNVNADGEANAADVQALIEVLNGDVEPVWEHYSTDCDHSGSTTPADLLCVIDLLNGGDAYAPGYNGTPLPANPGPCP